MKTEKSIYFPGVNGLRFLAALAVIITHVELSKSIYNYVNIWENPIVFNLGGFGVYFFFVLSGFLITYLLLAEKQKQGKIHIKQFYIRRILRIWPLYYLILVLGFFILPRLDLISIDLLVPDFEKDFNLNLFLYLLILPNVAYSALSAVPHIGQAWSIGVEEQFYVFWPWVIAKSKNVMRAMIVIIVSLFLLKVVVLVLGRFYSNTDWYLPLKRLVAMSKFECMAIGGIGAWMMFSKHKMLPLLYNKYVLNTSLVLIPVLIYATPDRLQDGIHIVYSFIFLIIILNVSNGSVKLSLENRVMNYLGKISYGIYMYHFMIIPIVLCACVKYLHVDSGPVQNILLYVFTLSLTIGISALSYELFEERFIKLKSRFSFIRSGEKE